MSKRWAIMLAAVLVPTLFLIAVFTLGSDAPIREQTCAELAETQRHIFDRAQGREDPPLSPSDAYKRIVAIARRVEKLGGCPGQPSLETSRLIVQG